jgi:predicted component of type VI protein secretion system
MKMGKKFDEFLAVREIQKINEMDQVRVKLRYIQMDLDNERANQKLIRTILKVTTMLNTLSEDKV